MDKKLWYNKFTTTTKASKRGRTNNLSSLAVRSKNG